MDTSVLKIGFLKLSLLLILVLSFLTCSSQEKVNILYDDFDKETIQYLIEDLKTDFFLDLEAQPIENANIDFVLEPIIGHDLLRKLSSVLTNTEKTIIVSTKSLRLSEGSSFLLRGLAKVGGHVALVSSKRILEESQKLNLNFEGQLSKAVKHELLHLYGLDHCKDDNSCIMVSSHPPANFHKSSHGLCPSCLLKLDSLEVGLLLE